MRNRGALDVNPVMTRPGSGREAQRIQNGAIHRASARHICIVELTQLKAECISYVYRLHAIDIVSGNSSRNGKEET